MNRILVRTACVGNADGERKARCPCSVSSNAEAVYTAPSSKTAQNNPFYQILKGNILEESTRATDGRKSDGRLIHTYSGLRVYRAPNEFVRGKITATVLEVSEALPHNDCKSSMAYANTRVRCI